MSRTQYAQDTGTSSDRPVINHTDQPVEQNRLLRALSAESRALLDPYLNTVRMEIRDILWEPDVPIEAVYFPRTCVMSLLVPLADALPIEAATVGREGFAGLPVLLGVDSTSTLAIAQVAGDAARVCATAFREIVRRDDQMLNLFLRHAESLHEQTAQSVACNSRHSVEQRCARWLLMTHDRVDGPHFYLTQQFLAAMLGVRRATVTEAAGALQAAGLIHYTRGNVTVLDRAGLESSSCECYGAVRSRLEKLLN